MHVRASAAGGRVVTFAHATAELEAATVDAHDQQVVFREGHHHHRHDVIINHTARAGAASAAAASVTLRSMRSNEWDEYQDAEGSTYYHHRLTDQTSWTRPD